MIFTKRRFQLFSVLAFAFILFSSLSITSTISTNDQIQGCWVYKSYKDGAKTFVKSADFKDNKPGFKFAKAGKMTKRLDPNWCVRVKGPYTNLDGSYEFEDEQTLKTTYQCPVSDKPSINHYKILELTNKKLIIKSLPRK